MSLKYRPDSILNINPYDILQYYKNIQQPTATNVNSIDNSNNSSNFGSLAEGIDEAYFDSLKYFKDGASSAKKIAKKQIKLNNNINYIDNKKDILSEVKKKYLGKKYIWGAKVGDCKGADCSALTSYYALKKGIELPRTAYGQFKFLKSKGKLTNDISSVSSGDLLYFDFKNKNGNPIGHTAIVVGRDNKGIKVLEASGSIGSVVERYLPKRYYSRIAGIGKL